MLLRELFYFNKNTGENEEDDSYDPSFDDTPMNFNDTRKTKLSLKQLNRIRKSSDIHQKNQEKELNFIKRMYSLQSNAEQGGL